MKGYSCKKLKNVLKLSFINVVKVSVLMLTAVLLCAGVYSSASKQPPVAAQTQPIIIPTEEPASTCTPEPTEPPAPLFINPASGVLTSEFGERWGRKHTGIDIGGDMGSDIIAASGGVVECADWVSGYGNYIIIDHENGYKTAYGHCQELLVSEGERVSRGDLIALMGSTGNSTGPHLHFEVKYMDAYLNPIEYVMY